MSDISNNKTAVIINWTAGMVALMVALSLPLVYFAISYKYQVAALQTAVEINALIETRIINVNPEFWRYEEVRISDMLERGPGKFQSEVRRILDIENQVVYETSEILDSPVLTRFDLLYDAGKVVGRFEISRSLRPLLQETGWIALLGLLLGWAVFAVMRIFPLRALRQALDSLSNEKEQLAVTLRSIGDGVITTDTNGRVLLLNKVAETFTGFTHNEAVGKPIGEVFRKFDDQTRKPMQIPIKKALGGEGYVDLSGSVLIAKDGRERIITDSGAPIRDKNNQTIGVVLVLRDVSDKENVKREILKAQKLESLGVLAGGIAHDFNNLLGGVLGNIEMARMVLNPGDLIYEKLANAEQAIIQATSLTRQLLTFSKGGSPIKEVISAAVLVSDSVNFTLHGSNVRCELVISDDLWPVEADGDQVSQVIQNLVINADQAMPNGGVLTVNCHNEFIEKGSVPSLGAGNFVIITIKDQGVGIPQEQLSKIFDPYYTTKKMGTGLGLTTSYSIIRKHGGYLGVESKVGVGTVFNVYLPATTKPLVPTHAFEEDPIHGSGTILLMDDEVIIRKMAREMLIHLGYAVEVAVDGTEAIERYKKAKEAGRPFDCVIMDLTIPGGMGGCETIKHLLAFDPEIKAIVSSGYFNDPVMAEYQKYGFKGFMEKPYKISQMSKLVQQVMVN